MISRYGRIAAAAALFVAMGSSQAALVNLSGWTNQGGSSTWTVAPDNNSVFQSVNGDPAVFFSGTNDRGLALSGKIKVETTTDDDFIGFVLGYTSGDMTAASGQNYILIDWKQSDQGGFFNCVSQAGLSISRVTAALPDGAGSWCHNPAFGVQELQRATTLGDTGWADNTEYSFDLVFTSTNIQVKVNGQTELNINGSFRDGSFGFYNYSQQSVRYSALTQDVAPPPPPPNGTPEPGTLALLGLAIVGGIATRRRQR